MKKTFLILKATGVFPFTFREYVEAMEAAKTNFTLRSIGTEERI